MGCPSVNQWVQVQLVPQGKSESGVTADGSVDLRGRPARKGVTGGWRTAPTLFGAAMFEAVVNLGIAFNLSLYLVGPMHLPAIPAATAVSNYWGASYLTSLLGGFVSDAFLGNYWTIVVAMLIELVGVALLIVSSAVPPLMPECVKKRHSAGACLPATHKQVGVCMFALYVIAVGAGSIRPCLSAFAGDQFDQEDATERRWTPSFFNWLVVSMTCGGILATTLVLHLGENVSWTWSFLSIGFAMMTATACFLAGTRLYRHQKPASSPLLRIAQVFVAAFQNRHLALPASCTQLHQINAADAPPDGKPCYLLRHTDGMRCLDKAAIAGTRGGGSAETVVSPWRLCTVTQVEEVKGLVRSVPIALSTMLLYMVLAQVQTWSIQQGYVMERRMGAHYLIPPASLSAIAIAVVLLEVAAYDLFLVPVLRRVTDSPHGLSHLQRIGTGLALSVVGLAYAALLEFIRLDAARRAAAATLSIFWQLPVLVVMGTAIFFAHAGLFEFFYHESPPRTRTLGTALSMLPIALGLFQTGGFLAVVNSLSKCLAGRGWLASPNLNHNHLDYFYLLMAAMSSLNLAVFLLTARRYQYLQFIKLTPPPSP